MDKARELLLKHLYNHGGDGLGISDSRVYMAVLDAIQEALITPTINNETECKYKDSCGHDLCNLTECDEFEQKYNY